MACKMIVYESEEGRARDPEDTARFEASCKALEAAGIGLCRVACASPDDIEDPEAREAVDGADMGALPISVYDGGLIRTGAYPTDQELADFLDVPDGTLSVNKQGAPAMGNDLPPACTCGNGPK